MSTSEVSQLAEPNADPARFALELERLANQFFSAFPGPSAGQLPGPEASSLVTPGVPQPPGAPAAIDRAQAPSYTTVPPVAPSPGPSALAVGAGGASPAVNGPPIPGVLKQPPIASAPLPKESDLRTLPAMFAETLGTTPVALAAHPDGAQVPLSGPPGATPYFLEFAGPPTSGRPSAPGGAPGPASLPIPGPPDFAGVVPFGAAPAAMPVGNAPLPTPSVSAPRAARFEPELSAGEATRHQL